MKRVVLMGVLVAAVAAGAYEVQPVLHAAQAKTDASSATSLGSVRIPRAVTANGQPLAAGTYRVRLTGESPKPAPGASEPSEQWVEFLRNGNVVGRELASVVPQSEIAQVATDRPPAVGGSKVEMLKGNDYLRVWINRGGNHYLINLPVGG